MSYNYRQVLGVLLSFAVKRGRVFPSLDTIARMAMCSKSTVLNAIAWLELYGFIDKLRRIVRTTVARSEGAPDEQRLRVELPERSRRSRRQRLPLGPRLQQLGSIKSNSEVKKGLQGSGFDLGFTAALGRLKFSVGRRSEA